MSATPEEIEATIAQIERVPGVRFNRHVALLIQDVRALMAQLSAAREALRKYGGHLPVCDAACTCGWQDWEDALAASEPCHD